MLCTGTANYLHLCQEDLYTPRLWIWPPSSDHFLHLSLSPMIVDAKLFNNKCPFCAQCDLLRVRMPQGKVHSTIWRVSFSSTLCSLPCKHTHIHICTYIQVVLNVLSARVVSYFFHLPLISCFFNSPCFVTENKRKQRRCLNTDTGGTRGKWIKGTENWVSLAFLYSFLTCPLSGTFAYYAIIGTLHFIVLSAFFLVRFLVQSKCNVIGWLDIRTNVATANMCR